MILIINPLVTLRIMNEDHLVFYTREKMTH